MTKITIECDDDRLIMSIVDLDDETLGVSSMFHMFTKLLLGLGYYQKSIDNVLSEYDGSFE